jgi:hypothetical protein
LFWKKNNPPLLAEYQSNNHRYAYRLCPSPHTPILMMVAGEKVRICNISSTGVAFSMEGDTELIIGSDHCVQSLLFLEDKLKEPIPLLLQVLEQQDAVYRCSLKALSERGQKALCGYLIKHQKHEIRLRRQAAEQGPA